LRVRDNLENTDLDKDIFKVKVKEDDGMDWVNLASGSY
jgi:hypothetical protein